MVSSLSNREPRATLEKLRAQYVERLQALDADRRRAAGALSADFAEQAVEVENDETIDALEQSARVILGQIDHAMQRHAIGLWSICESCGRAIEPARLSRLPEATRCKACAAKA